MRGGVFGAPPRGWWGFGSAVAGVFFRLPRRRGWTGIAGMGLSFRVSGPRAGACECHVPRAQERVSGFVGHARAGACWRVRKYRAGALQICASREATQRPGPLARGGKSLRARRSVLSSSCMTGKSLSFWRPGPLGAMRQVPRAPRAVPHSQAGAWQCACPRWCFRAAMTAFREASASCCVRGCV